MTELPNIGRPAKQALASVQIHTLEDVARQSQANLGKLHGVGPKALRLLETALLEQGLQFAEQMDFIVVAPRDCENAPKKGIMRDYLIASGAVDRKRLTELLTADFIWRVPGEFEMAGRERFIEELERNKETVSSLVIDSIVSHGKEGVAHGTMTTTQGMHVYFADFFRFENHKKEARIQSITSYVLIQS
ncbi:nuclear transport factor 2 family protein [Listeria costaricensis]|uniref:nuclear transport factor 2 family protein n=1 Tax=Listeria costaricensis TaxID=2026604 RepID=UPI000C07E3D7|nr:nuclear transport factor 2 family protein [Listeria costaricensis]